MTIPEMNLEAPLEMHINRIPLKKTASKQIKASMKMVKDIQYFYKVRKAPFTKQVQKEEAVKVETGNTF
jgi:hypothetical protein